MNNTLQNLIESISYSTIEVTIETPIGKSNSVMEIDYVAESEYGLYVESADGHTFEIPYEVNVYEKSGEYTIEKGDCYICIKTI